VVTVDELINPMSHDQNHLRSGGVTVSGGEPLIQPKFVVKIFRRCHQMGWYTAPDTSGYVALETTESVLMNTDLVLLDIKSYHSDLYHQLTSVSIEPILNFARHLVEINPPTWTRFMLVLGLTDPEENVTGLAQFVNQPHNVG
jgi:pyruvate formate lyase activating enzyme